MYRKDSLFSSFLWRVLHDLDESTIQLPTSLVNFTTIFVIFFVFFFFFKRKMMEMICYDDEWIERKKQKSFAFNVQSIRFGWQMWIAGRETGNWNLKKWKGTIDDDDENNSLQYILNGLFVFFLFFFALGVVVVVPSPASLNSSKSFSFCFLFSSLLFCCVKFR